MCVLKKNVHIYIYMYISDYLFRFKCFLSMLKINLCIVPDSHLERQFFQNFGLSHLEHQETPHFKHNDAKSVRTSYM